MVMSERASEVEPFLTPSAGKNSVTNSVLSRYMEQRFPFMQCEKCWRRTSWVIAYSAELPIRWYRVCPNCMSPSEVEQYKALQAARSRSQLKVKYQGLRSA